MSEELLLRMLIFQYLIQTGYTFSNALRIAKRAIKPLSTSSRAKRNSNLLFRHLCNMYNPEISALENIKAAEKEYWEIRDREIEEEQNRSQNSTSNILQRTFIDQEESKSSESSATSVEAEETETGLPKYSE